MIKFLLWVVFLLHTLSMAAFLALCALKQINADRTALILLSICGILTTLSFAEYVLKMEFEKKKNKKW